MNSSATDKTQSLSRLLYRRLFPVFAAAMVVAAFAPGTFAFFALKSMIPPERLVEARHTVFFAQYLPAIATGLVIVALMIMTGYIYGQVTRPLERLARWADERYRTDTDRNLRTRSRVEEIRRLAFVFARLFGEQDRRVGELHALVDTMRHNVKNRLTRIDSAAQFVLEGDKDAREAAAETHAEIRTVTRILDVNSEITRNYSRLRGAPATEVILADLVKDCLEDIEPTANEKDVDIDAEIPPPTLVAVAHRQKLANILQNLLENAVKYTPQGGSVTLGVRQDADGLTIEVADTGIGIADADKPHVFEREFRAENAKPIEGTGYGLSLVDSIVSFYGGQAQIRDNAPKGTIVTITLPLPISSIIPHPSSLLSSYSVGIAATADCNAAMFSW